MQKMTLQRDEKDRLAAAVDDAWYAFEAKLRQRRACPLDLFERFWRAARRYAEATRNDKMIHREVARHVSGLREGLEAERKRVPGHVLRDADRLEVILFSGYDSHFDGDEPPGL